MKTIRKILWGLLFLCPGGIAVGMGYDVPAISVGAILYMMTIIAVLILTHNYRR